MRGGGGDAAQTRAQKAAEREVLGALRKLLEQFASGGSGTHNAASSSSATSSA
eukprot:CAMPEP_0179081980 /NCGR_PEP_ID=MMETSP0796-20121207/36941_1 /TAXON_ID=73915 /ORGANISM="Pyrodinium bahamense, Strain pbaha01" /LENGTH=52 /DNA_ID=CAMNT_0020779371 /DNA_START=926 /DNA_END=1080 /DNA_ORIENTATION=-